MFRKVLCVALSGMLASPIALAASQQRIETITAQVHAGMALAANTLPTARSHFHHVINCLVDPDSKLFDKRAENPCAGMGAEKGALHDEAQTDAQKKDLQHALGVAQRGLSSKTLEVAHVYAEWLSEILKDANT
ncbi:hypothetical protein [Dokdonella soli]|uniref:Uncharacterized protein n=1 Tax=Dokdonella soli TaxID=529810 RepID=A0ABN1INL9_9GAMM